MLVDTGIDLDKEELQTFFNEGQVDFTSFWNYVQTVEAKRKLGIQTEKKIMSKSYIEDESPRVAREEDTEKVNHENVTVMQEPLSPINLDD